MGCSPLDVPELSLEDNIREKKVINRLSCLILTYEIQNKIRTTFIEEMQLGLSYAPKRTSSLQMENTFIPELPNGKEHGDYLALDLGGTNFRVILVTFNSGEVTDEIIDYYQVPEALRLGPGEALFNFIAECISDFCQKRKLGDWRYNLGFTFSFPMTQLSLDVGILVAWTKSFNCTGVVGKDAVQMLKDAIARRSDLNISVVAVLNDTTGTLVQGAFLNPTCGIGMILGTGSNACYFEKVERIGKWQGKHEEKEVIIDIEWGAFGDNGVLDFITTEWDKAVDDQSLLVRSFTFEKRFGGKFLGDLVREALLSLFEEGLFCTDSHDIGKLGHHGALSTEQVSLIEVDAFSGQYTNTESILESLQLAFCQDDLRITQYVAGLFSYRGALLVSITTAVLLEQMSKPVCSVAIDGSLFEHHPRFPPLMQHLISGFAPGCNFELFHVRDGSGRGAALSAAIAERLLNKKSTAL